MRGTAVINALLKSSEPSIRWKTRVRVLGEDPESKAIRALREEIPPLLALRLPRRAESDLLEERRLSDGGWPAEKRYYKPSPKVMKANADYVDWDGTSRKRMNEWVTVDALAVLHAAGRMRA